MNNRQAYHQNFDRTLSHEELHRGRRYGKKRRSWVSLIIHIIVLILTAIAGYSMWKEPIFKVKLLNQLVNFHQFSTFSDKLEELKKLPINVGDIDKIQHQLDQLVIAFEVFFGICILSLILTFFTILFNRTVLKIVNFIIVVILMLMTFGFAYLIDHVAKKAATEMSSAYLSFKPDDILTQSDAIHNNFILLGCSLALLFISLFFRNRRPRH